MMKKCNKTLVIICMILLGSCAMASIPGPELVLNGTFDTDTTGWTVYMGGWLGTDGDPSNGCVALDQGNSGAYVLQSVNITVAETYRFRYRFMSPDAGGGTILCYPQISFLNVSNNPVSSDFTYNGTTTTTTIYTVADNTSLGATVNWQTHEIEAKAGTGATQFKIDFAVGDTREFRFDTFSLQQLVPTCQEMVEGGYSLPGDLNTDCRIDLNDFSILALSWLDCIDPTDPFCSQPWNE